LNRTERLYKIQALLSNKRAVPISAFLKALEVSRATFRRDLDYLRDRLGAPIVWDRDADGYRIESGKDGESRTSLPGLWLNDKEILALLSMLQLLSTLEPNTLISHQIKPVKKRLQEMLETGCIDADELGSRVKILPLANRAIDQDIFNRIADALLSRHRLEIRHLSKGTNQESHRQVSPQQLVYYRDNWYLDAFCHSKDDLRSFAIDGIKKVESVNKRAEEVSEKQLHETFAESYGIFSGKATKKAKLKFTPERARWVAGETWHGQQVASFDKDGSYILEVPYDKDPELVMDILKHGAAVEVLAPAELKKRVKEELALAIRRYS